MWINDSYEAIHQRAAALAQEGKLEEAVAEYRRIVDRLTRLSPETLQSRPQLGEILEHAALDVIYLLRRLQAYDQAIEIISRVAAAFPQHSTLWQREAAVLRAVKGEVDAALSDMQALVQANPDDPTMRWSLAQIYSLRNEEESAQAQLIQSIDLAPDNETKAIGYRFLGDLHAKKGDVDQVAKAWDMVIGLDPKKLNNIQFVYRMLLRAGKTEKARTYIEQETNPLRRGLYSGIASAAEGDEGAARAQWRRVFRQKPQAADEALDAWAEAGMRLGEPQQVLDTVMSLLNTKLSLRTLILTATASAMAGNNDQAEIFFSSIRQDMMPARDMLLPQAEWELFNVLIADEGVRSAYRHHFDTGEAAPEAPATPEAEATESPAAEPAQEG